MAREASERRPGAPRSTPAGDSPHACAQPGLVPQEAAAELTTGPRPPSKSTRPQSAAWRTIKWSVRAATLILIGVILLVKCDGMFYYPSDRVWSRPADFNLSHEDVWFETSDGVRLHGWWLPAAGGAPRGTVVHFHGNAENVTGHLVLVEWLPRAGYNVLMFDYRGYGRSQGRVTRAGTIRDGHAALDYALSRPDVDPGRLFAYGQSLGGAVAVVVVAERPEIRALVAEAAFSGYRRIAARKLRSMLWPGWLASGTAAALLSDGHDPIDYVHRIAPRPLLVIAGERDATCEPELAHELYAAASEPKQYWLAPGAAHLEILEVHPEALRERILRCFELGASGGVEQPRP